MHLIIYEHHNNPGYHTVNVNYLATFQDRLTETPKQQLQRLYRPRGDSRDNLGEGLKRSKI